MIKTKKTINKSVIFHNNKTGTAMHITSNNFIIKHVDNKEHFKYKIYSPTNNDVLRFNFNFSTFTNMLSEIYTFFQNVNHHMMIIYKDDENSDYKVEYK